jgi:predicted nucleotidyltransferase
MAWLPAGATRNFAEQALKENETGIKSCLDRLAILRLPKHLSILSIEAVRRMVLAMERETIFRDRRAEILEIAAEHGARDVRVFGSLVRGEAQPDSDVDLLVTLEPGRSLLDLIGLKQDLEDLLGCRVDVITEAALSPYISEQVLNEAVAV